MDDNEITQLTILNLMRTYFLSPLQNLAYWSIFLLYVLILVVVDLTGVCQAVRYVSMTSLIICKYVYTCNI